MSGLYNSNFSPVRAASPQIRTNPEVDRYSYSPSPLQLDCFTSTHFLLFLILLLLLLLLFQSVPYGVAGRASEAWSFHASPSHLHSSLESRFPFFLRSIDRPFLLTSLPTLHLSPSLYFKFKTPNCPSRLCLSPNVSSRFSLSRASALQTVMPISLLSDYEVGDLNRVCSWIYEKILPIEPCL